MSGATTPARAAPVLPSTLHAGAFMVALWIAIALLAPWIAPYSPIELNIDKALTPPSLEHWLGTDNYGRDLFSRILWAARADLFMGITATLLPFMLGTLIGLASGYFGGIVDTLLMRLVDVTIAFPFFVLIIAIVNVLGPGVQSFFIAVTLVGWVPYARLARGRALVLKSQDFVLAARVLGYGRTRILLRHLLPNAAGPAIVFSMSDVVLNVLLASSLGYLGLGVQPPTAEWGLMVSEGKNFMTLAWWMPVFPGLSIVLVALAFSLLGDGLAERLDA